LYPDEHDYDEFFPAFLAAFGGEAFAHDTVWQLDDFAPGDAEPAHHFVLRAIRVPRDRIHTHRGLPGNHLHAQGASAGQH